MPYSSHFLVVSCHFFSFHSYQFQMPLPSRFIELLIFHILLLVRGYFGLPARSQSSSGSVSSRIYGHAVCNSGYRVITMRKIGQEVCKKKIEEIGRPFVWQNYYSSLVYYLSITLRCCNREIKYVLFLLSPIVLLFIMFHMELDDRESYLTVSLLFQTSPCNCRGPHLVLCLKICKPPITLREGRFPITGKLHFFSKILHSARPLTHSLHHILQTFLQIRLAAPSTT